MAQTLTGFTLNLAALGQTSLNPESHSILRNLQDLGRQMSQDIQRLVYTLRPAHLDELGLVKALEALSDRMSGSLQLEIKLKIDGPAIRLPQILETALFRIAQEALTNVSRHAQTRQVWIEISYQPEWVCLSVRDAGVGFQAPEDFSSLSGWGLVGIRERVESVGGQFKLTSRPGEGTSLEVKAPINLNQEDVHAGHSDTAR
jgi:signal transduction histidine kinase